MLGFSLKEPTIIDLLPERILGIFSYVPDACQACLVLVCKKFYRNINISYRSTSLTAETRPQIHAWIHRPFWSCGVILLEASFSYDTKAIYGNTTISYVTACKEHLSPSFVYLIAAARRISATRIESQASIACVIRQLRFRVCFKMDQS